MVQLENEVWKPTYVNPFYLISNKGRIKNLDRPIWNKHNNSYSIRKGKLLKANNQNSKKYWRIRIPEINSNTKGKMYSIHRLVATAFIPNPLNLPQINHINGNKNNNCVENLEWCDNGFNQRHAITHNLKDRAKMSAHSSFRKLTEEQIAFIKKLYLETDFSELGSKTLFCKSLAELFNLKSPNTIHWIVKGGTNKFFNQDIVQTTKYMEYLEKYNRIYKKNKRPRNIKSYAIELGITVSSFMGRYRMFNKDIKTTVNYYKRLQNMQ